LFCLVLLATAGCPLFGLGRASGATSYTGVIDAYPSQGWSAGWSVHAPSRTYTGAFADIQRTSDNKTMKIGYNSSHVADVTAFNSFCAGTYCYVTTLYDSFGAVERHENDWKQSTLAKMPQIAVGADGLLEICAAPNSSMSNAYSASQSTAKVDMLAVAYASTVDWNGWQANLPHFTIKGNLSTNSHTITNVTEPGVSKTFQGFSTASGGVWNPTQPGVEDVTHNNAIWWQQYAGTATAGSTSLTLGINLNNMLNEKGDTFQLTNAVIGGPWIILGPASSTYQSSADWGFGLTNSGGGGYAVFTRNAKSGSWPILGQYIMGTWGVYDWDTYTESLYYDGVLMNAPQTGTNVTYSSHVGSTLFSDAKGGENAVNQCFHQIALVDQVGSNRKTVDAWLEAQFGITPISTIVAKQSTSDGFALRPEFLIPYPGDGSAGSFAASLGDYSHTDVNGISWQPQNGGYLHSEGPSQAYATNVSQGGCSRPSCPGLWQFVVNGGDSDLGITQHPRSEINGPSYNSGTHLSIFYEFKVLQMPNMTSQGSEWCIINQVYYGGGIDCLDRSNAGQPTLRAFTASGYCGSALRITPGNTVYAVEMEINFNGGSSTEKIYGPAPTGSTLPLNCNLSGAVVSTSTLTLKQGMYTGDVPWLPYQGHANPKDSVVQVANYFVSTKAGEFLGDVNSQPAWPKHQ
jgi:hypothetical protein